MSAWHADAGDPTCHGGTVSHGGTVAAPCPLRMIRSVAVTPLPDKRRASLQDRVEELIQRVQPVFEARSEILCGYLFGSLARGSGGPLSDLDLAIWREPAYVPIESGWQTYWGDLHAELVHAAGLSDDQVDLVILNEVRNPLLAHRATWHGRRIFCRDEQARVHAETAILRQFLDTEYLRRLNAVAPPTR